MFSIIIIISSVLLSVYAENADEFVWILTEIIECKKSSEIDIYNKTNTDTFYLEVSGTNGNYIFNLDYMGETSNNIKNKTTFKKGDSASSSVVFSTPPNVINQRELVELSLELKIAKDTTYDKSYAFLSTQGKAFFDKAGVRPDIPSSKAIYFTEKPGNIKGTSISTKAETDSNISTTLYATAPRGETKGQKIVICLSAEGIITVGTKYVYTLVPLNYLSDNNSELNKRETLLTNIKGDVSFRRKNTNYKPVKNEIEVNEGTFVKTGLNSGCIIRFDNSSYLNLGQNSEILLHSTSQNGTIFKQSYGKSWSYIKPTSNKDSYKIEMKNAILKTTGTIFSVEESETSSTVWIFTGTSIFSSTVTGEIAELTAGEKASFDKNGMLYIENFSIYKSIDDWGIPISAIKNDGEFAWAINFIYILLILTAISFILMFLSLYKKKRRKRKLISNITPKKGHCVYCGKQLNIDDIFCSVCGAAVKKAKIDKDS